MGTNDKMAEALRKAIPYLREAGAQYADDGSNEPLELARDAEGLLVEHDAQPANTDAEQQLKAAGVFKGEHGLRGLLDAKDFWERQPYGTRLYYGDGIADYLHRDVLKTVVSLLDAQPAQAAQPVGAPDGLIDTIMRYPHNGTTLGNIICAEIPGDVLRAAMREALAGAPQPPAQPSADAESNG